MPVQTASWLSGKLWRLIAPRLGRQKRALANLELAYPEKSPRVIVCGLHLGNWEILAHGGQRLGVSLIGVYQRISNPHVEALMRSMREPLYKTGLTPKTPMAGRVLLRAIKDGACPCFLADLRDDNGPSVPFFGRPARSTVFPALLARTTGVPLYAGAAFRRRGARFSIRIAPISMPHCLR
jgi:Kdo2-lipid IVA lauroyltransferase/acyltransferase